ncbi:MAG: hypothetical protein WD274_12295 [Acidimicrobiia bacterium]
MSPSNIDDPTPCRIGIMCLGRTFPAWQAETIRSVLEIPGVSIDLLVIQERAPEAEGKFARIFRDPKHLLWNLYNKGLVQRRSAASRPVDLTDELAETPEVRCTPIRVGKYGERLAEGDVDAIKDRNLDLLLRFGFGILKGSVLESARYGIWSFHHGDERTYRGQPPAFWEMVDGAPVVGAILQRITERLDAGVVLHRGHFGIVDHSYRRTRDQLFLAATDFPSIAIRRILDGDTSIVAAAPSESKSPVRRTPGNLTMLRFLVTMARSFLKAQWNGVASASKWTIGVAHVPITTLIDHELPPIEWVPEQGSNRYFADPFPDPTGATSVVLVEDYDHASHRGVISSIDVDGDRKARVVLDAGVHASYPYLFEDDGVTYCVPETYQALEVRIYRSKSFPNEWELAGTILDGLSALDPTIIRHDSRWWLFCTLAGTNSNTKLYAFHSKDLLSGWEPHSLNPIKSDISSSRPGGRPFRHEGHLYRPAQDSSSSYGGAIALNRVDDLTPTTFHETIVKRIRPPVTGPYRAGIHTASGQGDLTVIDGRRDVFLFSAFRREIAARLKRLF